MVAYTEAGVLTTASDLLFSGGRVEGFGISLSVAGVSERSAALLGGHVYWDHWTLGVGPRYRWTRPAFSVELEAHLRLGISGYRTDFSPSGVDAFACGGGLVGARIRASFGLWAGLGISALPFCQPTSAVTQLVPKLEGLASVGASWRMN